MAQDDDRTAFVLAVQGGGEVAAKNTVAVAVHDDAGAGGLFHETGPGIGVGIEEIHIVLQTRTNVRKTLIYQAKCSYYKDNILLFFGLVNRKKPPEGGFFPYRVFLQSKVLHWVSREEQAVAPLMSTLAAVQR